MSVSQKMCVTLVLDIDFFLGDYQLILPWPPSPLRIFENFLPVRWPCKSTFFPLTLIYLVWHSNNFNSIRGSRHRAKLTRDFRIDYVSFLKSKVRSPPYCCDLLLDILALALNPHRKVSDFFWKNPLYSR